MARTRATAVSAIVLALGLTGAGATPFIVQSASASVVGFDPPIEPCDAGQTCDITPETTITVTTTLGDPAPEETEPAPETTVIKTVTASPTKTTKSPAPKKTLTANPTPPPSTPAQNPQPLPTQETVVPPVTPTSTAPTPEQSVEMPAIAPEETITPQPSSPIETQVASDEEVPLELRNAAPEFDQRTLTQKLSIPALVLVLLALFAVLIFEGRLRRMAHAAAVRKAGPPLAGPEPPPGGGYPAGPAYATAGFPAPGYPGGTAYAPIISFVPVQTYPSGPPQYGYQDPNHPYPPQGYVQEDYPPEPPSEPVVLHPDEFDSFSEPPSTVRERDPFEPVIPAEPPSSDIPPGGANPYDDDQEQPLGPASAAEAGDSEPWQHRPGSLFEPASARSDSEAAPSGYEPPPYLPADEEITAVQPLSPQPEQAEQESGGQEKTKEMPDAKRRRFGRRKK